VEASLDERPELLAHRDPRGRSWLHLCCASDPSRRGARPADSVRTADVLIARGLDPSEAAFREGRWKATPVWFAVARGRNPRLVRHLLELGADPEHSLWAAAFRDDVKMIRLLVEHGASIDPVTEDETPLLSAVKTGHFRAARALLDLGADIDFQDSKGRTALHHMLRRSFDLADFRRIVRYGPRGDLPDGAGIRVADAMRRKRTAGFRELADELAGA